MIKSVDAKTAKPDEYSDILRETVTNYCYIYSMEELSDREDEKYHTCFNIDGGAGNYDLTLSFSKSFVLWNEYCGIAWYEDDKWKKK